MAQRQQVDTGSVRELGVKRRQVCERRQRIADGSGERNMVGRPQDFVAPLGDRLETARRFFATRSRDHRAESKPGAKGNRVTHASCSESSDVENEPPPY